MQSESPVVRERRLTRRKAPRSGVAVACRRGTMGFGPDIALAVENLSELGACLRIKSAANPGEEVEVRLTAPGRSKPLTLIGDIRWVSQDSDEAWTIRVRFRKRIAYIDLSQLMR